MDNTYLVVESELDAILLNQKTDCNVIAIGSAQARPNKELFEFLQDKNLLISLDLDDAGTKASDWWLKQFKNSKNHYVPEGKDHTEYYQKCGDLISWASDGLKKFGTNQAKVQKKINNADQVQSKIQKKQPEKITEKIEQNCLDGTYCPNLKREQDPDFEHINLMICLIKKQSVFRFSECPRGRWAEGGMV